MPDYAGLVDYIVRRLVLNPDAVSTAEKESEGGIVHVTVKVAKEDIGRVIGKKGATISAIRLIAKAAAIKPGHRIDVDIEESNS